MPAAVQQGSKAYVIIQAFTVVTLAHLQFLGLRQAKLPLPVCTAQDQSDINC
jgi:hypothetical protein